MATNVARKLRYERPTRKRLSAAITIDVLIDQNGFGLSRYTVKVKETLRFQNRTTRGYITVHILCQDGVIGPLGLLGSISEFVVYSGSEVEMVVEGYGIYELSLEPSPDTDPIPAEPNGKRVTTVVSS